MGENKAKTMTDAQGNAVLAKYVKPYDRQRDAIARRVLRRWEKMSEALAKCYAETAADIEAVERAAESGRGQARGKKGNFQFQSFDGLIAVSRTARYELRFDERLRVAREIIDELVAEKAAGMDEDFAVMLKEIFRPTSDGMLSQARVMGLFRWKIKHPRWLEAMDLIRASIESRRGKNLLAVRHKAGRDADWQSVLLDVSAVAPEPAGAEGGAA